MTIEQIDQELLALDAEKDAIKTKQRELTAARDQLVALKKIEDMNLPPNVKATVLGAFGIKSEEAVGTPGK